MHSPALMPPPNAALLDALERPRCEDAIGAALPALARGGDLALLQATLKALVRAGLAGIAVQLLERSIAGGDHATAALTRQLSELPSGAIEPGILKARAAQNLHGRLLSPAHHEGLTRIPESALTNVRVYVSRWGNVHILRDEPGRGLECLFQFRDHAAHAERLALPDLTPTSAFVLLGVPSPQLFHRLLGLRRDDGYHPPIDIIEPDSNVLAMWLALFDDTAIFAGERIALFHGPDAVGEHLRFLEANPFRAPGATVITSRRPGADPPSHAPEAFSIVHASQQRRTHSARVGLEQRYGGRDALYWRRRFAEARGGGPPLRVVGLTSRFSTVLQHAMRDVAAAFARRGCEFDLIKQPHESAALVDLPGALLAKDYELIVVIDHLRFEFRDLLPSNVPFVGWIQDHMAQLCDRKAGESVAFFDMVIGHSPQVMHALYGYPVDRFLPSSNLTDPQTYDASPLPEDQLAPFRCDVSYVSHGSLPPEAIVAQTAGGSPSLRAYLERFLALARTSLASAGFVTNLGLVELLLQAERESGHPPLTPELRRNLIYPSAASMYDRLFRHQAIEWAASWARSRGRVFHLYGKGWEHHPTFGSFARGEVKSGHDLRRLYQATAVSLQVNGYSSLHQRLLDGLAAGAFMLARYNPADFVRRPYQQIQQTIRDRSLRGMTELAAARASDEPLHAACLEAERLSSASLHPSDHPARQRYIRTLREGNPVADLLTDEGLFASLQDLRYLPTRAAADLEGFESCVFRSEAELHELLDRYVDDPDARHAVAAPMRRSVLDYDTYDALVERIFDRFDSCWAQTTADPLSEPG
jgi:hypothetical protein